MVLLAPAEGGYTGGEALAPTSSTTSPQRAARGAPSGVWADDEQRWWTKGSPTKVVGGW
ncbi:hypothetical protein [Streptomyces sp. NRRL S-378]|uniref:hypothetical protein n=1 Tax=Streptomyces sp. NRRL S-378 TaxID=1463904 RepID=UPI00131A6411|nr:hypothetical protein [Streptomyces sp. NRRL S-378]